MSKKNQPLSNLLKMREDYKKSTKTVLFTNGCFDILHAGHVSYLQAAKKYGDILIIGLNSDQSIQAIKGPTRPIIPQQHRLTLLCALDVVDHVVIFDEETPVKLVEALKPDYYIKGADYTTETLPEYPIVKRYGGKVALIPLVEGLSTSTIISKIQTLQR